jgi:hypothetical protein
MSTACSRRTCWSEATYVVRDSPLVQLCSQHAAQICLTDVVMEKTEGAVERMVAA